jgi:hypothetical protein
MILKIGQYESAADAAPQYFIFIFQNVVDPRGMRAQFSLHIFILFFQKVGIALFLFF